MTLKYSTRNFILFVSVFLLQVMVFNNVDVYGFGFPMIYIMAIFMLPVVQPPWFVLIVSFQVGLSMDFFSDTGGLHAASTTLMGFGRMFVLNRLEPQAGYTKENRPGLSDFRIQWVVVYMSLLTLVHHFGYFLIEEGNLARIGVVILKTVVSGLLSLFIMLVLNIFLFRK